LPAKSTNWTTEAATPKAESGSMITKACACPVICLHEFHTEKTERYYMFEGGRQGYRKIDSAGP
jgi:hypothetical protein